MHHHGAIAILHRLLHAVRDHERRELVLAHDRIGDMHDLFGRARIQRRRVLVEQQQLRPPQRGHEQRHRLALAARERSHRRFEPSLEPHAERREQGAVAVERGAIEPAA